MKQTKFENADYRFGEFGPGYVLRGPRTDAGIVKLRPGDEAENHYHANIEETFYCIEGECTVWVNCETEVTLRKGDILQAEPKEMHYFVNNSDVDFRAIFIKAPYDPKDTIPRPWVPGEPKPEI